MRIALVSQSASCSSGRWRRHSELYKADDDRVQTIGRILEQNNISTSIWTSLNSYWNYRQKQQPQDEMVFSIAENCFERNRAGLIPAIWELSGIPYVGSDLYANTIAADKLLFQSICKRIGFQCPQGFEICHYATEDTIREDYKSSGLKFPLVLKYRYGTMSYGLSLIKDLDSLIYRAKQLLSLEPDSSVLCQEYIAGQEVTVPIIGTGEASRALSAIQYVGPEENPMLLYDYRWKNEWDELVQLLPFPEESVFSKKLLRSCLRVHRYLGLRDMSRIDMRLTNTGEVYFLEANCIPSLGYDGAFDPASYGQKESFDTIVLEIIQSAWSRNLREE